MTLDDLLQTLVPGKVLTMAELAEHFGMSTANAYLWKTGIPVLRQLEIENMTGGRLRAGPECDRYRVPHLPASDAPATGPGALDEKAAA